MSVSGSSGGSRSKQYAIDPAASARMAAVEERLATMSEGEYDYGVEVFRPYEREMIQANRALLPLNQQLMEGRLQRGVEDLAADQPIRKELRSQQLDALQFSRPAIQQYFNQATDGINVGQRKSEAVAGVEHQFGKIAPNLRRSGLSLQGKDLRNIAIEKAKAKAGASTYAGTTAETEKFGRLGQAMDMRQGFTQPSLDITSYAQGQLQTGGYTMRSPLDRAGNLLGAQIQANAPGMGSRTKGSTAPNFNWSF